MLTLNATINETQDGKPGEELIKRVKKHISILTRLDGKGFLKTRTEYLALCFAIAELRMWNGCIQDYAFFESGSYFWTPHDFTGGAWHSSAVPVFMAIYGWNLKVRYIGHDASWGRKIKLSLDFDREETQRFSEEERGMLQQILPKIGVDDYGTFKELIIKEKKAVIISHQTLTDPNLDRNMPFWTLPGLHIHTCIQEEVIGQWTDNPLKKSEHWGAEHFWIPKDTEVILSKSKNITFVYNK
jgi:hypothetical protein